MRLTPEYMSRSQSYLNPLKERELDLRGLQIPVIENLASHQGTYDVLNLTDNSLTSLASIPLSTRLHTIHASQNQITSISPSLPPNIPNLITLVLTNNVLTSLASVVPLENLSALRYLSLRGNPITEHEHYRSFVIWKVAKGNLHVLDFERVKDSERDEAIRLFTDPLTGAPNALAQKLSIPTTSSVPGATLAAASRAPGGGVAGTAAGKGGKGRLMTVEEKRRVVEALTRAQTAEEVRKLERMLAEGLIPEEAGEEGGEAEAEGEVELGAEEVVA